MSIKVERLKEVPPGAWAAFCVVVAACAAILLWAPPTMWAALGKADWPHVAGVIGLVSTALALAVSRIVAAYRHAMSPLSLEPPVLPSIDGDAEDTARLGRRRQQGFARPPALVAIGVVAAILVGCALLNGCGASAVRIHATSATIATQAASAFRAELVRARGAAITACEAAQPLDTRGTCLDEAERHYTAASAAFDLAVLAIADYREAVEVAHLADDQALVAVVLSRAKGHAAEQWDRAMALARALGAQIPSGELALAQSAGGAS